MAPLISFSIASVVPVFPTALDLIYSDDLHNGWVLLLSSCSSQTITLAPSLAAVYAAYEPQGPPPTTTMSGLFSQFLPLVQCFYYISREVLKDSIYKRALYYPTFLEVLL